MIGEDTLGVNRTLVGRGTGDGGRGGGQERQPDSRVEGPKLYSISACRTSTRHMCKQQRHSCNVTQIQVQGRECVSIPW